MESLFWITLDQIGIVAGLLTFIASVWISIMVYLHKKKLKQITHKAPAITNYEEAYEKFQKVCTHNPMALAICLVDDTYSIKNRVKDYLRGTGRKIRDANIVELIRDGINNQPEDIQKFINELKELKRGKLSEATEIHLFIAGPLQAAVITGAVLSNWIPIIVYNLNNDRTQYEYWGPLLKKF